MNKRTIIVAVFVTHLVIAAIATARETQDQPNRDTTPALQQQILVSPLYGLDDMLQTFTTEAAANAATWADLDATREKWLAFKKAGGTKWGSDKWMKTPEYYQKLPTTVLIRECFSTPTFWAEVNIYDDRRFGVESLRIFHNGFAELFRRDDLWQAVIQLYSDLGRKIDPDTPVQELVTATMHLDTLEVLYLYTPLRTQVRGREALFAQANLDVVKRYVSYLDNYSTATARGAGPLFLGEACTLVKVALMLISQTDLGKYIMARTQLSRTIWTTKQEPKQLREFLRSAVQLLDK